jgi:hypothetical protein
VDAALATRGADPVTRRQAAETVARAIFAHPGDGRRRTYVIYALWRALEPPRRTGEFGGVRPAAPPAP